MNRESTINHEEQTSVASVASSGMTTVATSREAGAPRTFPCEGCGADLHFNVGEQKLKCPYCGFVKDLHFDPEAAVEERDFATTLERLAKMRAEGVSDRPEASEVRCRSCGATVVFAGTLTSTECPYCGVAIQRDDIHQAEHRIPVDGVLPFLVDRRQAQANLLGWIKSRWFAPNDFKRRSVNGKFSGVYLPYWTYDALTGTYYNGQRGEHYWVTVGSGQNQRRERRTRWFPVSGSFERFFDDVMVPAATGIPTERIIALEPWPLARCVPFNEALFAGLMARTYDVPLDTGFDLAKALIERAIEDEVRTRIGGDVQQIHSIRTQYGAITYKHLLLPVWMMAYRYGGKSYQVVINAGTGEVQGDRPYSWIKIALTVAAGLAAVAVIALVASQA